VFSFNTETYYKKNLKPFDTSINLQGLEPKISKVIKDNLKDIPKNKITEHEFVFEELKG
jgi:translation elongation factor EF-1beta